MYLRGLLFVGVALMAACDSVDNAESDAPTLCLNRFQACVNPVLNAAVASGGGCASSSCHGIGGSGGNFRIENPATFSSFLSAVGMTTPGSPGSSRLLTHPTTGTGHTGGTYSRFEDTNDTCYQDVAAWISTVVSDPNDVVCGSGAPACFTVDPANSCQ